MPDQAKGHGHHAITREAVHELFTSGRGEMGADGRVRIRGMTEDEYFEQLDTAQEYQDRIVGGDTWHDAALDPDAQRHHAMADPHKSGEQNVADIRDFITGELESARAHADTPDGQEMQHLGAAAHALEDSYSNAHAFRGDAAFQGDPTAPIESLNVFHPLGLHHGPGGATDLVQGTHDHYLDAVPVGPGTGHRDAYSIAHNADGSVPLQHQSDLAGAHATAEMLERYEDHRDTAETGAQALGHAVDPYFHMDPSGVGVNDNFSDASFQQELNRRVHIEQHQEEAAQHHTADTYQPSPDHAWYDAGQLGDYEPGGEAQQYGSGEEA